MVVRFRTLKKQLWPRKYSFGLPLGLGSSGVPLGGAVGSTTMEVVRVQHFEVVDARLLLVLSVFVNARGVHLHSEGR